MSAQELLEKYKTEINSHNFDRVEPLISKDCKFWFSSGTFHGLEQTRKAFEKTWAMIQNEVYSITDVEWLSSNDQSAVCAYTYHWAGLINGQQKEGKVAELHAFVLRMANGRSFTSTSVLFLRRARFKNLACQLVNPLP